MQLARDIAENTELVRKSNVCAQNRFSLALDIAVVLCFIRHRQYTYNNNNNIHTITTE